MKAQPTIHSIIELIESRYPQADPGVKFFKEVDHYFCGNKAFKSASSEFIYEDFCMLELKGLVGDNLATLNDIKGLMYEIWKELSFEAFEASSCIQYRQASVLRFVTVPSYQDYYISGRMIVNSVKHKQLVENYENALDQVGNLADLPEGLEALAINM